MARSYGFVIGLSLLMLAWGCSGAPAEPTPTSEPSPASGGETEPIAEEEAALDEEPPSETAEQAPAPSGPAQLTVNAKAGTGSVPAHIKISDADGAVVAEGEAGTAFTVQAGELSIEASITDAAIMVDTPTTRDEVSVAPGETRTVTVEFPHARVKVIVKVNGSVETKASVTLLRNGRPVVTLQPGSDFVSITPGRFSAIVKTRGAEIEVPNVVISEGASANLPLDVTF